MSWPGRQQRKESGFWLGLVVKAIFQQVLQLHKVRVRRKNCSGLQVGETMQP